ncbi:kinesin family protein [Microsporum canis CBS 113480]|uniref:Kinesin family protein n=1 Tax=Arthroderma otae (strain ATCC MYA-4605 / CBS 113480) TaxID=554155 RepID=C5FYR4_ARTOC|nr:kinesin family protein [Microsporum canis CBS 113480]EEQ34662.1 kinesin family protein [Microsporum canis CBS 113480]
MEGGGGNIKVVVRVRPFNSRERDRNAKCIVQMKGAQTVLTPPPGAEEKSRKGGKSSSSTSAAPEGPRVFAFDKSYWSFDRKAPNYAGQDDLFSDLGAPLLDNAFQGYNNCIFAYGQTGSGKSYSMMGYGEEAGVIPKICKEMFQRIAAMQAADKNLTATVEVSYLEIYNERVRDLLNPANKGNLKVREHPSTGPYVEDLAKLVVQRFPEIEHLMDEGNKARTVAATNMNETSSRSHAVFTLTLTQKRHDAETTMDTEKVSRISLVDLAGSERATSTGATGARLKEGAEINRSLSTLGRVIAALADLSSGKKKAVVPYRDSVLTWLLKDSLGGNSMTAMIAAISPADINYDETLSTLRYANSAKRIKNHAVVNEDPNARMIRELKEELAQLRSKLGGGSGAAAGGGVGAGMPQEEYPPGTPLEEQMVTIVQPDGSVKKVSKAEIVEQLDQSEKLYKDLNQTWEEKLQKTEEIHKEREAALEELGISIEKGFVGLSTPKKMPHLVNLSDDPLLAECLVYNIKPGTTTVGNVDAAHSTCEIRLNGSKILHEHCTFEHVDNIVTVIPCEGAAVMVNGVRIDSPQRLRSGFRIILGDFHIFRFNHPMEARAERVEQSLLRHSVTTSQLGSSTPVRSGPGHDRNISKTGSEIDGDSSRSGSPLSSQRGGSGREDWFYARREAANAILGTDHKISALTDDELDALFDDVQKARAVRKGFYENRFLDMEEDSDSLSSYPIREKKNYVRMVESVLQHASLLKEAQVMSHIMDKNVFFQFAIVDVGQSMGSSYDLVLNGISGDDDVALDDAKKPCIAVRVIDFKHNVILLWSLDKLERRVQAMRQMHQYIDRPDYIQHFKLENPFSEQCSPTYSLVGDADVPLTAVFESRVQDFSVEAVSIYTQNVIGILRLSLEPSAAQAPSSTLKFNVVMRDLVGFAEREGTDVHAQLFVPGISEEGGATTTQIISGFDENPVQFESVHSMSLPLNSPRTSTLKVSIFALVSTMHLDKLLSWDEMRDAPEAPPQKRKAPRIAESEYFQEERHDVFAGVQILELAENGEYLPVDVVQANSLEAGTYQLHQGLQRRIVVNLAHSSTESLPWDDLTGLRVGGVRLLDPWGKVPDLDDGKSPDIPLKMIQEPMVKDNADGSSNITIIGQWDSSSHGSLLLDRTTADKYRVQITLRWNLISSRLQEPIVFELDQSLQILGRSSVRPQSMFKQFWTSTRVVHSTSQMFSVAVRPVSAKRAADLWRMNTQNDYIKGEELLTTWSPRKVSLIKDYIAARKRRHRVAEIEAARAALSDGSLTPLSATNGRSTPLSRNIPENAERRDQLLRKYLSLWSASKDPTDAILVKDHIEPPLQGAAFAPTSSTTATGSSTDNDSITSSANASSQPSTSTDRSSSKPRFLATITHIPKNPTILKSGYLYTPDDTYSLWVRRFVELRLPYLHIYSVPDGDEINVINLRNSHVDHDPDFARLLVGSGNGLSTRGQPNVFAVFGTQNTFLFASRTEAQKIEWILKIDEGYFSGINNSNGGRAGSRR